MIGFEYMTFQFHEPVDVEKNDGKIMSTTHSMVAWRAANDGLTLLTLELKNDD